MRKKKDLPRGYDSWFEVDLHNGPLKGCVCHEYKVEYSVPKNYYVDFTYTHPDGRLTHIESKGRFRTYEEASKYLYVRETLAANEELVFVFVKPDKPMPGARARKDGTKRTHREWAESNGFTYYSPENTPKEWSTA